MIVPSAHPSISPEAGKYLLKNINNIKDVSYFKSSSAAYKNLITFIDCLCSHIKGTWRSYSLKKHKIENKVFLECSSFLDELGKCCDETDLKQGLSAGGARFGLAAFRDWYDEMTKICRNFVYGSAPLADEQFKQELLHYLSESFGNRMRIDYGTGHELNFVIFMMGMSYLAYPKSGDTFIVDSLTPDIIKRFVQDHGWDLHALFSYKYIRLCRKIQKRFRLEPAGSRGVYNMDDYQFLPFLFGSAQLCASRGIGVKDFYSQENVENFASEYILFEAVEFILDNKRGPFNEHSYTLWNLSGLGSWENMYRRIRSKFDDDVLTPFPIVQHLLFGRYIFSWDSLKS